MNKITIAGVSLTSIAAAALSYYTNKSILWALVHGLIGWLYLGYRLLLAVIGG